MYAGGEELRFEGKHVVKVFDEVAATYDRGRWSWYRGVAKLAEGLGSPLLDVGAGTGAVACILASKGVEVVAADSSLGMLRILWRRARRRRVGGYVNPVAAHLPLLPFRDQCFAGVLAVATIHHVYGRQRRVESLKELLRVVRAGGRCVVTVWYRYHPKNLLRALKWLLKGWEWGDVLAPWRKQGTVLERYYHLYGVGELKRDLRAAGAEVLKVELWDPRHGVFFKRNVLAVFTRGKGCTHL